MPGLSASQALAAQHPACTSQVSSVDHLNSFAIGVYPTTIATHNTQWRDAFCRTPAQKLADFNPDNKEYRYIRMYMGLEDAQYLIADLKQALEKV